MCIYHVQAAWDRVDYLRKKSQEFFDVSGYTYNIMCMNVYSICGHYYAIRKRKCIQSMHIINRLKNSTIL